MTNTLSSSLSPRVIRVSESRYVTSNSPLPVFEGGLKKSGSRGTSKGGSCDVGLTVVCSNFIFILELPTEVQRKSQQNNQKFQKKEAPLFTSTFYQVQ